MLTFKQRWLGIAALSTTAALIFMDQTILSIALPTIQKEFLSSEVALQWAVNAYLLALTVFSLAAGKLSDRIGARRALCLGIFIFVFSSFLCGLSFDIEWLIGGRALQGVGGSLMLPAQSALISAFFPPKQRGRSMGTIVSIGTIFMIFAPMIGGYLTEMLSWRWIFWVNLPIGAAAFILIPKYLPYLPPGTKKIDPWGFLFFAIAVTAVTFLFMQANDWGWASAKVFICLLLTLTGFIALAFREKKISHPFLDLSLFKKAKFSAITLNITVTQFVMMVTVFQTIYFQTVLGLSPSQTGAIQFASGLPVLIAPIIAGFLSDRFTPKLPIAIGFLCFIFSCLFLSFFNTPSVPSLIIALMVFSIAIPFVATPSYSAAMAVLPQEKMGIGFGMLISLRWFSAAMGLALTQLFVSYVQKYYTPSDGETMAKMLSFSWVHFTLAMLMIVMFAITFTLHKLKSGHKIPELPGQGWD